MPPRPGRYITNKRIIQNFIESHPWYGKRFILEDEVAIAPLPTKEIYHIEGKTPTTRTLAETMLGKQVEAPVEPPPAERVVEEVSSGRTAKDWIIANIEGVTSQELKNNEQIRAVAAKLNLVFPNWK